MVKLHNHHVEAKSGKCVFCDKQIFKPQPNQDPLDDPILGSILRRFGQRVLTHDVSEPYAFEDAVKQLLKWRSDYVMGLIGEDDELPFPEGEERDFIIHQGKRDYYRNQLRAELRAKNERGE